MNNNNAILNKGSGIINVSRNNIEKIIETLKRGDVVLCNLGEGKGSEQSGVRPCVVIQNDVGNRYSPTIIVATITSSTSKAKLPTHIEINERSGLDKPSIVLCEQIRTIDKQRVVGFLGTAPKQVRKKIDGALITSLEIFKRGEDEVKSKSSFVSGMEKMLLMNSEINSIENMKPMIMKFKEELISLENLCKSNKLYMKNYYIVSDETQKLLASVEGIGISPMLKIV